MQTKPEPGQPILVNVGERVLELKFPLAILKELDREYGISVLKGSGMTDVLTDPGKLAVMLYYGLKTKQPDVTLAWVETEIDASMLLSLAPLLAYGTTGRWPRIKFDEDEEANPPRPASRLPGSQFGPSDDTTSESAKANSGT